MATLKYEEMVEWIETHEPCDKHPYFPVDDWKRAVANDQFREGYQEWLLSKADEGETAGRGDVTPNAQQVHQQQDRLGWDSKNPLKIRRWLRSGEIGEAADTGEVLQNAAHLLDAACTGEILGDIVFQGEDGVYYVATVEAVIGVANPELVQEVLEEEESPYTAEYWDENRGLWIDVLRCGDLNQAIDHARRHARDGRKARVVEETYDAVIQVWPKSGMAPTEQRGKQETTDDRENE